MLLSRSASLRRLSSAAWSKQKRLMGCCHWFDPQPGKENVWQVDVSCIKYGRGVLREVGEDCLGNGIRNAAVYTDKGMVDLPHLQAVIDSLKRAGIDFAVYDEVKVEPTDKSLKAAIAFANSHDFDGFISVGGGSVIDTCKAAALYSSFPPDHFLDYVNPPIGRGLEPELPIKPHIACPTTAGTGSECTGLAIFDLLSMHAKTGIATRRIRPTLAVVDPDVTSTMPANVVAASAARPSQRPMSQGSNPWSDLGCENALRLTGQYLVRAVENADDDEARERMMFASTLAGIAFGNAGCHLPHGLSYSVSGLVRDFRVDGYPQEEPMVPHGYSVIVNAPSVFRFTADACPDRHTRAGNLLAGKDNDIDPKDAGDYLAQQITNLMQAASVPNGLKGVGYGLQDVPDLVKGAMPQKRLLDNAPKKVTEEDVSAIYSNAMTYW